MLMSVGPTCPFLGRTSTVDLPATRSSDGTACESKIYRDRSLWPTLETCPSFLIFCFFKTNKIIIINFQTLTGMSLQSRRASLKIELLPWIYHFGHAFCSPLSCFVAMFNQCSNVQTTLYFGMQELVFFSVTKICLVECNVCIPALWYVTFLWLQDNSESEWSLLKYNGNL